MPGGGRRAQRHPGTAGMLDVEDVRALDEEQPETPPLRPEVLESVLDKVRWRRRRSRWMTSAAVGMAAALLAVGLVIAVRPEIVGLQTDTPPPTAQELAMAKVAPTPFNATISLTGYGWGTRIDMACTYGDWGRAVTRRRRTSAWSWWAVTAATPKIATWLGLSGATALPSANTPMQMDEIAAVQLVSSDNGKVLLEKQL